MAINDIKVWKSPHGGSSLVRHFPLNDPSVEGFFEGEPVSINGDGEVTESADEPIAADLTGLALAGPGVSRVNPKTGNTWATGDMVPVSIFDTQSTYITPNWTVDGSAFDDTAPAATDIGETVSLTKISDVWGVDNGPAANAAVGRVEDILNERKESILVTGETVLTTDTFYIVFSIIAHAGMPDSGEAVAPLA